MPNAPVRPHLSLRPQRPRAALLAAAAAALACPALAGGQTPAAPQASPQTVEAPSPSASEVTVVAPASGYRSTITGRSYALGEDLQKGSGSLADVLSHVPSVQVDLDGNVSLRGDSNVTILVDGKPSALFSGPNRAQAIQAVSAGQYERVEVMTNPPAGITPEGSGGVINLITKPPSKGGGAPTETGAVKASVGSGGRISAGVNGAYQARGLSLTGGADFRRSGFLRAVGTRSSLTDPASGEIVPTMSVQTQNHRDDTTTLYGSAGYDIDPHDHLDANLNITRDRTTERQTSDYATEIASGPLALTYEAPGRRRDTYRSLSQSLGLTHALPGDAHDLSVKLSYSQNQFITDTAATYAYQVPVQPNLFQDVAETERWPLLDLKIDYRSPAPGDAKAAVGYEGKVTWQTLAVQGVQGQSQGSAAIDPAFTQRFALNQTVHALYATYERTFGKLTVQPGLRFEATSLTSDLVPGAAVWRQSYTELFPSLHLDYALTDASQVKASYGRRLQRPDVSLLDPFEIIQSSTSYAAGNPNLKPAITQSWELGYEYRRKTTDLQATVFYRDKTNLFSTVTEDIGANVLLSTSENIGRQHDLGVELIANREIFKSLTINASTDLVQSDLNAGNLGLDRTRSLFAVSVRSTANWKATPQDYVQLGAEAAGRQLTAQGYRGGAIFANLGWRHQIDPRLSLLMTADNPFGMARRAVVTDTAALVAVEKRKFNPVALFLGFTYALGAVPRSADNFDFGGSGKAGR